MRYGGGSLRCPQHGKGLLIEVVDFCRLAAEARGSSWRLERDAQQFIDVKDPQELLALKCVVDCFDAIHRRHLQSRTPAHQTPQEQFDHAFLNA